MLVSCARQKKVHRAFSEYRQVLERELDRENLSNEDRFKILEMLRTAISDESEKDVQHKKFVLTALGGKSGLGGK